MKKIQSVLKDTQNSIESEGAIQTVALNKSVILKNAKIQDGKSGKYAIITLELDKKEKTVHTSSGVLVSQLETMLEQGLGDTETFEGTLKEKVSESSGRRYYTFE